MGCAAFNSVLQLAATTFCLIPIPWILVCKAVLFPGAWCILFSLGFLVLACLPLRMPRYYASEEEQEESQQQADSGKPANTRCLPLFYATVFAYYFVSCGIERIYQPMASTFGLCGPLDLSPPAAATTDSFYNGGFMCGRIGKDGTPHTPRGTTIAKKLALFVNRSNLKII